MGLFRRAMLLTRPKEYYVEVLCGRALELEQGD